jgi:uncharacterized protein (DUF4415 family)
VKRHVKNWHSPLPENAGKRKKQAEEEAKERFQASAHFRPRRKIAKPAAEKFYD